MSDGITGERSVRVRIEGRVQGVGFRNWVELKAGGMGLAGWVRNRRDASVEALFCGPAPLVARMLEHCRRGPPAAAVAVVTVLEEGCPAPVGFMVLPTI